MNDVLNITKALADKNRVRLLLALLRHELCVCQITELLGLAMSTTSKHLSILAQAGLLQSRKDGRWIYYSIDRQQTAPPAREALVWLNESLAKDPCRREDARRIGRILKLDPVELCKRQGGNSEC